MSKVCLISYYKQALSKILESFEALNKAKMITIVSTHVAQKTYKKHSMVEAFWILIYFKNLYPNVHGKDLICGCMVQYEKQQMLYKNSFISMIYKVFRLQFRNDICSNSSSAKGKHACLGCAADFKMQNMCITKDLVCQIKKIKMYVLCTYLITEKYSLFNLIYQRLLCLH